MAKSCAQRESKAAGRKRYPQTSSRLGQGRWTKARPARAAPPNMRTPLATSAAVPPGVAEPGAALSPCSG